MLLTPIDEIDSIYTREPGSSDESLVIVEDSSPNLEGSQAISAGSGSHFEPSSSRSPNGTASESKPSFLAAPSLLSDTHEHSNSTNHSTSSKAMATAIVEKQPTTAAPKEAMTTHSTTHTTVLDSGEKGLGDPGHRLLATKDQDPTLQDSVVGGAHGQNPELITRVTSHSNEPATAGSKPWYKRLTPSVKSSKKDGNTDDDDTTDESDVKARDDEELPPAVDATMGSLAPLDASHPVATTNNDSHGRPRSGTATSASVASSVKDRVLSEHEASPTVSNDKFHNLFSLVPKEDELIEDYRCALQKDILVQGRIFISEHHLAFKANIFGWETSLCIPFSEIVTIEKRMTALVVPNAIEVTTLHARHNFASFMNRDAAYALIVDIWRHNHPGEERDRKNKSDTDSVADTVQSKEDFKSEISYQDEQGVKKKHKFSNALAKVGSVLKPSSIGSSSSTENGKTEAEKVKDKAKKDMANDDGGKPGHEPTEYDGEEYANVALDCVLPTTPEKAYELFIHDSAFLKGFFEDNQGLKEVNVGEWESAGDDKLEKRHTEYIKPLSNSMGPKQTHCKISDENEKVDPEACIVNVTTTQTPDVPAGSDFSVKTKSVFTWSEEGGARVKVTTEVEWTKTNRMLRGIIERSCIDGQKKYHADLEKAAREHIEAHEEEFSDERVKKGAGSGGKKSDSKKEDKSGANTSSNSSNPLQGLLDFIDNKLDTTSAILIAVVVVLVLTNLFTLNALRVQARAAHQARLGHPDEVASAVSRALDQFSSAYTRSTGSAKISDELHAVVGVAQELEKTVSGLVDRLKGVRSLA